MSAYGIIGKILANFFRAFLLLTGFAYLFSGDAIGFILFLAVFILSLLPVIIGQLYNIRLHWLISLVWCFMLSMHMFGFLGAYLWVPFYDDIAHVIGSLCLAGIGFAAIYFMNYSGKIHMSLPCMGFFTFIWTMAIGAVWEIIEFTWDNIAVFSSEYGFSQNSLLDTMSDLSIDATAGILAAVFFVYLMRHLERNKIEIFFHPLARLVQKK